MMLAAVTALLLLAACGSDAGNDTATAESAGAATQTTAATEVATPEPTPEPREIEHELGTTTITGVPQRIVVLEYSFADNLGSLGIVPVGYAVDAPPAYLAAYTADVGSVAVGTRAEPDLEAIVGLTPDLIIADLQRHEEIYPLLSGIAPTVVFNSLRGSYQDQLDTFVAIAAILGEESTAAELLGAYETEFDAVAGQTNADAGSFMIGVLHSGGFTAHSNASFMGSFLEGLGRTNALEPRDGETQYLLSLEDMASVNPSAIVVLCTPADQSLLDALASEPVWQNFDAVKNDRVYAFDRELWSKGRGLFAYAQILADAVESGLLADTTSSRTACGG
jgi:iron complex transport system substrate-binding protein